GNGSCERMNQTLINMIGTLPIEKKKDWGSHIATLVHAYNCTQHTSTGYSPYYLMFGRKPKLPIDALLPTAPDEEGKINYEYTRQLKDKVKSAYDTARKHIEKSQQNQKRNYDTKVRGATLQKGDKVLVKEVAFEGPHKLADKWSEEVWLVESQPNSDIPVFKIRNESRKTRTVHRNLLLPIASENTEMKQKDAPVQDKNQTSKQLRSGERREGKKPPKVKDSRGTSHSSSSSSDTEEEELIVAISSGTETEASEEENEGNQTQVKTPPEPQPTFATPDTPEQTQAQNPAEHPPSPEPPTPRPRRRKFKPAWMNSGEYAMAQASPNENWKERANYLFSLTQKPGFSDTNLNSDFYKAILSIVTPPAPD
ncbi:MAG: hypothetical protein MJA29_12770, partial [Candidatus Omnitrophica bacterium]|nr:hypothetical protein [Candidatus Omnitrophota bacterium]